VIAPAGPIAPAFDAAGIPVTALDLSGGLPGALGRLQATGRALAGRARPDVIHVQGAAELCRPARAAFPDVPIVFTCHGNVGAGFLASSLAVNRWADLCHVLSEVDRRSFVRGGTEPRKLRVVPNGVPVPATTPEGRAALAASLGVDPGAELVVATLARLAPAKGIDVLIRSAALLPPLPRPVRFVVAGEGPQRARLAALARRLGVEALFRFPGFVPATGDLLALATLYAHPARHEPFALAVLEAMASGRAIVGSRVGGMPDQVAEGVTGRLVPPADPSALAAALAALLGDDAGRAAMGQAARARHAALFTLERCAEGIEALYLEAIGQRAAR
jgi:glycosyltransferase involved in cell wall biosynthesis